MINPATYDITIQQNATFERLIQLRDSTGAAVDMTGYSVKAQVWSADRTRKLADFVPTWVNQAQGSFRIVIPATETAKIGSDGVWDLLITNPDSTKDYYLRGVARLEKGYTT